LKIDSSTTSFEPYFGDEDGGVVEGVSEARNLHGNSLEDVVAASLELGKEKARVVEHDHAVLGPGELVDHRMQLLCARAHPPHQKGSAQQRAVAVRWTERALVWNFPSKMKKYSLKGSSGSKMMSKLFSSPSTFQ
jgi:hypothetical protein